MRRTGLLTHFRKPFTNGSGLPGFASNLAMLYDGETYWVVSRAAGS